MTGKPKKNIPLSPGKKSQAASMPPPRQDTFALFTKWGLYAILAITAIVYSRVVFCGLTNFDDDTFIVNNPLVKAPGWDGITDLFTTIKNGKYQPLITLTFLLEYRSVGFDPVVFHLTSVILHLCSTWLLFKFTKQLSGNFITGFVVAALFAVHPMHVEEVTWASELKDTLPTFFYLFALNYYVQYQDSGFKWKYYVYVFLFFVASLLSKFSVLTMPLVLIAIDLYRGQQMNMRMWAEKAPFLVLSLFFLILGLKSQHADAALSQMPTTYTFVNRLFLFTYVPSFYIVKLFAPFRLAVMYYYPLLQNGALPWYYYASLPFFVGVMWLVFRPSPYRKDLIFGMAFFFITIWLMEQIISVGPSLTPERYTYIPYIGFFYIIGQWLSHIWEGKWRKTAIVVFSSVFVLFSVLSWARIAAWKDDNSIFGDAIEKNQGHPDSFYPFFMLGDISAKDGNFKEALQYYNESISLNPNYGEAYNNRGVTFYQSGDLKSALSDFNNAVKYDPGKLSTYNNRASLKASIGDFKGAVSDYDYFLQKDATNTRAYCDRGMVRLNLGDTTGGCADFRKSLELGNGEAAQLLKQFCH